jgi:PIN domain nuclease of toxin-antitoxin system
MFYVADTHAWVFYLLDKLPKKVNDIFASVEKGKDIMFIPTISLAECVYLVETGKIALDYKELFNKFEISNNFIPVSLNLEITKMLPEIKLPELHDRIIVATAKILGAKLITKDKDIVESRLVETIWV